MPDRPESSRRPLPSPEEIVQLPPDGGPDWNRLIFESSPYLLQHAANPVDWYPWGPEAFAAAAREGKPIFLSIGYSTCHWCHVMEHESFENDEVAAALRAGFIAIKVDREERPDIDQVYMAVCQAMTGQGGWPLTILMTPDRKPFWAGTYLPRESRFGRPGLLDLLAEVRRVWEGDRTKILDSAEQVTEALRPAAAPPQAGRLGPAVLAAAASQLQGRYDRQYGGFGQAPKFPSPHDYTLLLRQARRSGDDALVAIVAHSLRAMRLGGVFDQVGFGFHRYSTDRTWLLPHFEKMLYDQAMLVIANTEAAQATGDPFFARTAREILTYVLRDMTEPEGGFDSAEDADSEGEEGKFYVWTLEEWTRVLGPDDGPLFASIFGIEEGGNFHDQASGERPGTNIPHLARPLAEVAAERGMDAQALEARWDAARAKLFDVRERRVHPGKDDKVLTAWNGLMIAALAKAARAFDEPRWTQAARRAADFVLRELRRDDGRLLRRWRRGKASILGYADDHAFLAWGLLGLWETTHEPRWLREAVATNDAMLDLFWDPEDGGLFFYGRDGETLLHRRKEAYDGAIPSANSAAASNLLRLARLTGRADLEERAGELLRSFSGQIAANPAAHAQMLQALDFGLGPSREVVLAGAPGAADTRAMLGELRTRFLPRTVSIVLPPEGPARDSITVLAPWTEPLTSRDGQATAYVCRNFACELPVTDPAAFARELDAAPEEGNATPRPASADPQASQPVEERG